MASAPARQPPSGTPAETTEQKFRRLAASWEKAIAFQSSSRVRENHPAYLELIGLGPAVVPFLLRDLQQNERHWFSALHRITGANPVAEQDAGNIPRMVEAWLQWAHEHGYRW